MPEKSKTFNILSTRKLNEDLSAKLLQEGFNYKEKDFIDVTHTYNEETFSYYLNNPNSQARIFTSKNAVISLQELLAARRINFAAKKNFTVGIKATEMLAELGIKTHAKAGNAISLAQIIARNPGIQAVDFFCGNQSLDDLPEYLETKGIKVHKEIVYHTELVQHNINTENLNGIIFLSPTAVYSFFKNNKLKADVPCFCIGATTSVAVHFKCKNPRIEADEPSIESVVEKIIKYFK